MEYCLISKWLHISATLPFICIDFSHANRNTTNLYAHLSTGAGTMGHLVTDMTCRRNC
jgi:hypothetical protein